MRPGDKPETFFAFGSFTTPVAVYRCDVASGSTERFRQAKVAADLDRHETNQVFYVRKDGTRVPMFIVHKKGLALDGSNLSEPAAVSPRREAGQPPRGRAG